jgi:hypothetical protein
MGHALVEQSRKTTDFCAFSVAVMEKGFRLAVKGNSSSGRVVLRQRVPEFEGHRIPSTASRREKR